MIASPTPIKYNIIVVVVALGDHRYEVQTTSGNRRTKFMTIFNEYIGTQRFTDSRLRGLSFLLI